jgi:hypothetical protein
MTSSRTTVVRFPVWPDRSRRKRHYFRVFVFDNRTAMKHFWKAHVEKIGATGQEAAFNFLAVTSSWTVLKVHVSRNRKVWTQDYCMGHLLFYRQRLGAGIVAHEATHAALRFAEVILKLNPKEFYHMNRGGRAAKTEETLCNLVGSIVAQFWQGFYARAPRRWQRK